MSRSAFYRYALAVAAGYDETLARRFALPGTVAQIAQAGLQAEATSGLSDSPLAILALKSQKDPVIPLLPDLIQRLRAATTSPGAKSQLAKAIGVTPTRVSAWLKGKKEPSGGVTLRLLAWVLAVEAKHDGAGSDSKSPDPKTRSTRDRDDHKKDPSARDPGT